MGPLHLLLSFILHYLYVFVLFSLLDYKQFDAKGHVLCIFYPLLALSTHSRVSGNISTSTCVGIQDHQEVSLGSGGLRFLPDLRCLDRVRG